MTNTETKSPPPGEIQGLVERAMALANAATRGPWRADTNNGCKQIKADKDGDYRQAKWRTEVCSTPGLANEDEDAANAAFIAASRQLIPELCEAITRLSQPSDDGDGPCFYCGELTSNLAGDPGRWPLIFAQPDGTGVARHHHVRCVVDRLSQASGEEIREAAAKIAEDTGKTKEPGALFYRGIWA